MSRCVVPCPVVPQPPPPPKLKIYQGPQKLPLGLLRYGPSQVGFLLQPHPRPRVRPCRPQGPRDSLVHCHPSSLRGSPGGAGPELSTQTLQASAGPAAAFGDQPEEDSSALNPPLTVRGVSPPRAPASHPPADRQEARGTGLAETPLRPQFSLVLGSGGWVL